MRFQDLPKPLRYYIGGQALLLLPVLFLLLGLPVSLDYRLTALLIAGSVLFSTWRVELALIEGSMTVANAAACLALLLQGPHAATLCGAVGALAASFVRSRGGAETKGGPVFCRPEWYRAGFNVANGIVSCGAAALLYHVALALVPGEDLGPVVGLVLFTGAYFLLNTLGVAGACALQQGRPWADVWRQNFLWTAPGFFAGASVAAVIFLGFRTLHAWAVLFVFPMWLIYRSHKLYVERTRLSSDRMQQDIAHIQELNRLNRAIISSLATAIDAKDRYTCSHINRVQHYAMRLAEAAGLDERQKEAVATGALVHDIGKLGIPDHILGKPGKLTQEEFARIQSHVLIGAEILSPIPFPFPVVDVVLAHHERWDGLGYPRGLRGEEIPVGARIIAIVDVFDALTSNRPYRRAMTHEEALQTLRESAGKHFDPHLVALFQEILPEALVEVEQIEVRALAARKAQETPPETVSAFTQISHAAAEMATVCEIAHSLAELESAGDVAQLVVDRALSLLPADTAVLYLRETEGDALRAVAAGGRYATRLGDMEIRLGEGITGRVARSQEARVNAPAAPDVARRFGAEETIELSAVTVVPLLHGPETLGVLSVYTAAYNVMSEHHLRVLNILAEHAAGAIKHCLRQEHEREIASLDPLTGLANSRGLVRHLERLLRGGERYLGLGGDGFSIVMLDIDNFKQVNDNLGHLRGDDLLREIAERLMADSRPGDVSCRYAGDEFVLLLPETGNQTAARVAERLRRSIEEMPPVDGKVKIGVSIGIATFPADGVDGRTLLNAADERMYTDKFQRRETDPPEGAPAGSLPIPV